MISSLKALAIALLICTLPLGAAAEELTARQVLDRVDDLFRGESCRGEMSMHVVTANYQRGLSLAFVTKGKDKSLFRILAPKKEEGAATLRVGPDVWNYLPKVRRVIKLPGSMMSASWMGSHFTNDDLVKESRMSQDYTFKVVFRGVREGKKIMEIDCRPKPRAAVVWGKVLLEVWEERYLPLVIRYYDEDLKLSRTMVFDQIKDFGKRRLPARVAITPADKPGESTEVLYHRLEFNQAAPDGVFSIRNLTR